MWNRGHTHLPPQDGPDGSETFSVLRCRLLYGPARAPAICGAVVSSEQRRDVASGWGHPELKGTEFSYGPTQASATYDRRRIGEAKRWARKAHGIEDRRALPLFQLRKGRLPQWIKVSQRASLLPVQR